MAGNNHDEGTLKKKCPFLGEWCIGDACACSTKITRTQMVLGVMKQTQGDMCAIPALCEIMSSLGPQLAQIMAQRPQQMKIAPQIFKG